VIKEFITASKISNAAEKISVVLCIIGVNAALLSFILGGVSFLDAGALALIPAFLFFLWSLFSNWDNETKDYCLSLILIILCIIFALFHKYQFEVGATDDGYHNAKIVAYSIKNSFQTKFQYISPQEDERYFLVDSIESLWGIFWRWFHWDYIIVCLQAFPLLILWKILVTFFRQSHLKNSPALLAFLIVASMPILWCQQNSTYIDGTSNTDHTRIKNILAAFRASLYGLPTSNNKNPFTCFKFFRFNHFLGCRRKARAF
jgi:hypothetical protein